MRLSIALAAIAAIFAATPASAGFVNNRPMWNALSDQQKSGFVMAVIDNMMIADITSPYATADGRVSEVVEIVWRRNLRVNQHPPNRRRQPPGRSRHEAEYR